MKPLQIFYSDITALAKDRAYTHINLDEMTIHQVTWFRTPFNLISNTRSYKKISFLTHVLIKKSHF